MVDIIFINGSPGSGKTTISKLLRKKLKGSPLIELDWLRCYHLNEKWTNASKNEEQMSFENLKFMLKNYVENGYKNIIVTGFQEFRIKQISKMFQKYNYVIISLIIKDKVELKNRILGNRDSGFKNFKKSISWNNNIVKRKDFKNESKIDNTHRNPNKTINLILNVLEKK